jgi:hypothetical protein
MLQIEENIDALFNDVVSLVAVDVDNHADAAGIVLVLRVVESVFWG